MAFPSRKELLRHVKDCLVEGRYKEAFKGYHVWNMVVLRLADGLGLSNIRLMFMNPAPPRDEVKFPGAAEEFKILPHNHGCHVGLYPLDGVIENVYVELDVYGQEDRLYWGKDEAQQVNVDKYKTVALNPKEHDHCIIKQDQIHTVFPKVGAFWIAVDKAVSPGQKRVPVVTFSKMPVTNREQTTATMLTHNQAARLADFLFHTIEGLGY